MHDLWRDGRLQADGTFLPRIKEIDGNTYDIANLSFSELPEALQASNMSAAGAACTSVERALVKGMDLRSSECIEWASRRQHENWIEENEAWADDALLVDYSELSEKEKEKDRVFVRSAIQTYTDFAHTVFRSLASEEREGKTEVEFLYELAHLAQSLREDGAVATGTNLVEVTKRVVHVNMRTRQI